MHINVTLCEYTESVWYNTIYRNISHIYGVFDFLAVVYIVHLRSLDARRCCYRPFTFFSD